MRRRLIIIVIFLLAGAVVNVAVAWGCWLGSKVSLRRGMSDAESLPVSEAMQIAERLGLLAQADPNDIPIVNPGDKIFIGYATTLDEFTILYPVPIEAPLKHQLYDYLIVWRFELGWPIHSMRSYATSDGDEYDPPMPLLPVWPGFAVNTVFYAALLWLLICGPFALRRFIRVKRDLCPACAYPMGESNVCSECGKALSGRATVAT